MLDRARLAAIVLAVVACKTASTKPTTTAPPPPPPEHAALVTAHDGSTCTPPAGTDVDAELAACTARGADCAYTQALICRGVDVGDEVREQERRAAERGDVACECVCPSDRERCAEMP